METVYVVTLWSGGKAGKRWKSAAPPELLPSGTGVKFRCIETKLDVHVIGSVSVEEFEQAADMAMEPEPENRPARSIFLDRPVDRQGP